MKIKSELHPGKLAYTVNDFCNSAGISRTTLYEEIKAGRLKSIKCGNRRLIRRADGEAWLDRLADVQEVQA